MSLRWVDRHGKITDVEWLRGKPFLCWRLSPDGQKAAYSTQGRYEDIWMCDLVRGTTTKLTSGVRALHLSWSPDGQWIAFAYTEGGMSSIGRIKTDGSAPMEHLTKTDCACFYMADFVKDGESVLINQCGPGANWDVWEYDIGSSTRRPVLSEAHNEMYPAISPDGRLLAYTSDETGRNEVYVTSFPPPGHTVMLSNHGGQMPVWAPTGHELYYLDFNSPKASMMAVGFGGCEPFATAKPRLMFEHDSIPFSPIRDFDIAPDGERFLMCERPVIRPVEITRLTLVQNWFEELKRLCPTGR